MHTDKNSLIICISIIISIGLVNAEPMIGADVFIKNKYVWRGVEFNSEAVLWPDLWLSWYGITVTGWASIDLTDVKQESMQFTDIAIIADYTHGLGPISASLGYLHYMYPGYNDAFPTTGEAYIKIATDLPVGTAALTVNYDVIEVNGLYVSPSIKKSFLLGPIIPALSLSAGFATADHNLYYYGVDKSALTDLTAGLSIGFSPPGQLANYLMISIDGNFAMILDSELADNFPDNEQQFWFGGGLSVFYTFGGE